MSGTPSDPKPASSDHIHEAMKMVDQQTSTSVCQLMKLLSWCLFAAKRSNYLGEL